MFVNCDEVASLHLSSTSSQLHVSRDYGVLRMIIQHFIRASDAFILTQSQCERITCTDKSAEFLIPLIVEGEP